MNDMALNWTATELSMACLLKHAGKILERMNRLVNGDCGKALALRFRNACINAFAQLDEEACYDDQSPLIDSLYKQLNVIKAV